MLCQTVKKFFCQAPGLVIKKSGGSLSTDDDINDVTAMGGVNLSDEARRLGSEHVGSVLRSTRDTAFLQTGLLHQKVARIYENTLSTLPYRIHINGTQRHLERESIRTQVRALLLTAIRALVLWRQLGGNALQLEATRAQLEATHVELRGEQRASTFLEGVALRQRQFIISARWRRSAVSSSTRPSRALCHSRGQRSTAASARRRGESPSPAYVREGEVPRRSSGREEAPPATLLACFFVEGMIRGKPRPRVRRAADVHALAARGAHDRF